MDTGVPIAGTVTVVVGCGILWVKTVLSLRLPAIKLGVLEERFALSLIIISA